MSPSRVHYYLHHYRRHFLLQLLVVLVHLHALRLSWRKRLMIEMRNEWQEDNDVMRLMSSEEGYLMAVVVDDAGTEEF